MCFSFFLLFVLSSLFIFVCLTPNCSQIHYLRANAQRGNCCSDFWATFSKWFVISPIGGIRLNPIFKKGPSKASFVYFRPFYNMYNGKYCTRFDNKWNKHTSTVSWPLQINSFKTLLILSFFIMSRFSSLPTSGVYAFLVAQCTYIGTSITHSMYKGTTSLTCTINLRFNTCFLIIIFFASCL